MSPYPKTTWTPAIFDPASGAWQPAGPLTGADAHAGRASVSLVTWNVWFGEHRFADRARALIDILGRCDADLICLQEVTPPFLDQLLAARWVREGYRVSDSTGGSVQPYGVALLLRPLVRSVMCQELPTSMARNLVVAELLIGGRLLTVGTVHLESRRHNADVRAEQLQVVLPVLRAAAPDALLAGDFNMSEDSPVEPSIPPDFVDLWPALRGAAPGYTMDTEANLMTARDKGRLKQARFDRVLLRSPGRAFRPRSIELIGTGPITEVQPELFPSDHFGLRATIQLA